MNPSSSKQESANLVGAYAKLALQKDQDLTHQDIPEVVEVFPAEVAEVEVHALRQQRVGGVVLRVQVESALQGTRR